MDIAHLGNLNKTWAASAMRSMRDWAPELSTVIEGEYADLLIIGILATWTARAAIALMKSPERFSAHVRFEDLDHAPCIKLEDEFVASNDDLVCECVARTGLKESEAILLSRQLGRYLLEHPPNWPCSHLFLEKEDGCIIGRLESS